MPFSESREPRSQEDIVQELTQELGRKPTDFELKLLAFPGDKDGLKALAVRMMMDSKDVGYAITFLGKVEKEGDQKDVNELAVDFKETLENVPKNPAEEQARKDEQARIRKDVKAILDRILEEE